MSWSGAHWNGSTDLCRVADGAVHPSGEAAEFGWVAPASGRAFISGQVSDADTSCGDGVRVEILASETESLWGPTDLTTPGAEGFCVIRDVAQNEMLSFQTSSLSSTVCDTTSWSVEIAFDRAD